MKTVSPEFCPIHPEEKLYNPIKDPDGLCGSDQIDLSKKVCDRCMLEELKRKLQENIARAMGSKQTN
jgi:hypothetical protein